MNEQERMLKAKEIKGRIAEKLIEKSKLNPGMSDMDLRIQLEWITKTTNEIYRSF